MKRWQLGWRHSLGRALAWQAPSLGSIPNTLPSKKKVAKKVLGTLHKCVGLLVSLLMKVLLVTYFFRPLHETDIQSCCHWTVPESCSSLKDLGFILSFDLPFGLTQF
jgi:hypothetical protein